MAVFHHYVSQGMRVVGSDGNDVGTVESVRDFEFVVRRGAAGAVTLPFDTIQNVLGHEIVLNIPSAEVGPTG